jgi:hypothetical protein
MTSATSRNSSARSAPKRPGQRVRKTFTAKTADKYELYQYAVQSPEIDLAFVNRVFKRHRGRRPLSLCEDFCGTCLFSSEWVRQSPEHAAEGFDIDPEPVAWGRLHNLAPLGAAGERVRVHLADVRNVTDEPVDVRIALNFSYSVLHTRAEMLEWFLNVRKSLKSDGLFVMDMHGGPEAIEELEETRPVREGFKYVWEQRSFWPGTGEYHTSISFRFRDGTELKRAFNYHWRFWFLTEIKDILRDAGFQDIELYFECADKNGDGNGVFRRTERGANDASWIAYVVALR